MTRSAVTLLETLVVVCILGIVFAIILPAVESAREAARRAQCQNNLRQIALATQTFHNAQGSLPSLYNGTSLVYPLIEWDLFHMHSWRVPLLPHLEQSALRDKVNLGELATEPANAAVATQVVPVFICPSGPDAATNTGWGLRHASVGLVEPIPPEDKYHVVRSDYDALAGIQVLPEPLPKGVSPQSIQFVYWGVWGSPQFDNQQISGGKLKSYRAGKFSDIVDGLSNTIAIVERGGKPTVLRRGKPSMEFPDGYYPGQVGWSASNTFSWALNTKNTGVNESNVFGIYSLHTDGANVAFADGSIHFLSASTDFETLKSLFAQADGQ